MIDSTQVVNMITDSLSVAQTVVQNTYSLGEVLTSIAPLLYFIGVVAILATAFFIWDSKENKKKK